MTSYESGPAGRRWPPSRVAAWVLAVVVAAGAVYIYQTRGVAGPSATSDTLSPELAAALACAGAPPSTGGTSAGPAGSSPAGSPSGDPASEACHPGSAGPVAR